MRYVTLEEQLQESLKMDPRLAEDPARARALFLLGAQAVLESFRTAIPQGSPDIAYWLNAMERVNEEIGEWLGIAKEGSSATH